ncbi:phosphonate C-P lyase system protein PhnH [Salibacterium sp. K-3]
MNGDMTFNLVHDSQAIYREMLEAVSRPGTISNIQTVSPKLPDPHVNPGMMGIALTLLDGETSFALVPESLTLSSYIHHKTGSREEKPEKADYIFLYDLSLDFSFAGVVETMKKGTLTNPHDSATLIVQVESFTANHQASYVLSGPGIAFESRIHIEGMPENWEKARQSANREFPTGIDLFFISEDAEIMSIPRTTRIKKG